MVADDAKTERLLCDVTLDRSVTITYHQSYLNKASAALTTVTIWKQLSQLIKQPYYSVAAVQVVNAVKFNVYDEAIYQLVDRLLSYFCSKRRKQRKISYSAFCADVL